MDDPNNTLGTSHSTISENTPIGINGELNEWSKSKICHICDKKFNLSNRKKNCGFCGQSVCNNHSLRTRTYQNKTLRICDNCEEEIIINEISSEISKEFETLKLQKIELRATLEKLEENDDEISSKLRMIENELTKTEETQNEEEENYQERLNEASEESLKERERVELLTKALEESNSKEKELNERCVEIEEELEEAKKSVHELAEKKEELTHLIENLEKQARSSIPINLLVDFVCGICRPKFSNNRTVSRVIKEDDEELQQSRDEYNESWIKQ